MQERVVVTGLGAVSPYGIGVDALWTAMTSSLSGIDFLSEDYGLKTKFAGQVKNYQPSNYFTSREIRRYDPFIQYGILAAREAVAAAQLNNHTIDKSRCAVFVGSGIGGIEGIERECLKKSVAGARKVSPFFIPSTLINMVAGFISIEHGFRGPNFSAVSACATGAHNLLLAAQAIQCGSVDLVLAGGAEHGTTSLGMAGFSSMRALSVKNDDPKSASRPWDKTRDGFVMSDGAGILVLESLSHATKRGATILAELTGYGMSSDANHMTQPDPTGNGAFLSMKQALQSAQLTASDIGYINAHATSTPLGDENEPKAIKRLFGDYAYKIPVSSTKSMHGHMLGAAGAAEAIITIKSLNHELLPPTINCEHPDDGCDLDFVREGVRQQRIKHALTNSFGFGGTNASLIFSLIS